MVKREYFRTREDGVVLYKTYSDLGNYIKQVETNSLYDIAIDVENAPYNYVETDEKIEYEENQR
jgi:hypothetical protein